LKRKKILTFLFSSIGVKQRVSMAKLKYQSVPCPICDEPNKLKKKISLNKEENRLKNPIQNKIKKKVLLSWLNLFLSK
jgi:hypothetical protein